MRLSQLIASVGLALLAFVSAAAERTPPRALAPADETPARVIVKFKADAAVVRAHAMSAQDAPAQHERALAARAAALGSRHGLELRSGFATGDGQQVVHGPAGLSSSALAARLALDPDVAWAEPDRRVRRTTVPNDTLFASGGAAGPASGQWYLKTPTSAFPAAIDAVRAWDQTTGNASLIVAVLDTGITSHPDLAGKTVPGYDMISDTRISNDGNGRDSDPSDPGDWLTQSEINADTAFWSGCEAADSSWHGTMTAGLIGALTDNGAGMAGTGWNVKVMPVRVLGKCFGYVSDIVAGIRWAAGLAVSGVPTNPNPAKVINLSLGLSDTCSTAQADAIAAANAAGAVVVAAAGNSAGLQAGAPANCPGAIGVAAVRHVGSKVGFSDVGAELSIAAPGGNCVNTTGACLYPILTTTNAGAQAPGSASYTDENNASVGTSFSAPLVSATAALMLSANPGLTPAQVKAGLQSSARAFPSSGLTDAATNAPLTACRAPNGTDQLECYCTKTTCGAGMLDAAGAVAAALGTTVTPPDTGSSGGGGGGGATSTFWLAALLTAVAALRRRRAPVLALGASAALLAAAGGAQAAGAPSRARSLDEAPVHGLIVQLRDAPSHAQLARDRARAAGVELPAATGERARWQRIVAQLPALRDARRQAVGESAQLLRFERPMSASAARELAAQVAQRPEVAWAEPNTRERRLQVNAPSDPLYPQQWWLQPVVNGSRGVPDFLTAWTQNNLTGSPNSLVAVLDNGIVSHPDLAGKVVAGIDLVSDPTFSNDGDGRDTDPSDPGDWVDSSDLALSAYKGCEIESSSWHGTAIAGMIAAQVNNEGVASINWPGRILPVRVAAKCGADVADIIDGILWTAGLSVCVRSDSAGNCLEQSAALAQPRARVINISFGGTGSCTAYQSAIDQARARGVVIVAAAGNEYSATPTRPARCPGVIGVVALNRDGYKSTYSNFGSTITISTVGGDDDDGLWGLRVADSGLTAPGNSGTTGPAASTYPAYYGTSFSTPLVAGAVSLMLAANPNLTADQITQGLRASARPHVTATALSACSDANPGRCACTTATCGAGILDVPQALAYAANPGGYVAPVRQAADVGTSSLEAAAALGADRAPNTSTSSSGGGGGGASSLVWLVALAAACVALSLSATARRRSWRCP